MTNPVSLLTLLSTLAFALPSANAWAEDPEDLLIIGNNGAGVSTASTSEIRSIFLKKKNSWSTGDKAAPLNAPDGTNLRRAFQERVLEMTEEDEQKYWADEKVKSGLVPPGATNNPLKAVFSVKSIVSYVFRRDLKADVAKVIASFPTRQKIESRGR